MLKLFVASLFAIVLTFGVILNDRYDKLQVAEREQAFAEAQSEQMRIARSRMIARRGIVPARSRMIVRRGIRDEAIEL